MKPEQVIFFRIIFLVSCCIVVLLWSCIVYDLHQVLMVYLREPYVRQSGEIPQASVNNCVPVLIDGSILYPVSVGGKDIILTFSVSPANSN